MRTLITAAEMARQVGIDPKAFRAALRATNLSWHREGARWEVITGSQEHHEMQNVLDELLQRQSPSRLQVSVLAKRPTTKRPKDESYVIDLCDAVLGQTARRGHRFDFLRGDVSRTGRRAALPVDAYYPDLKLVIEYHEQQHSTAAPFFDRRATPSGVSRGEQRKYYDDLRRKLLPQHGIELVVLDYREFSHDRRGRLLRVPEDRKVIEDRLRRYLEDVLQMVADL